MKNYLSNNAWYNSSSSGRIPTNIELDCISAQRLEGSIRYRLDMYGVITVGDLIDIIAKMSYPFFDIKDPNPIAFNSGWTTLSDFKFVMNNKFSEPNIYDTWLLITTKPNYIE